MEMKLVEFVLTDRSTRFMSLSEIPIALGWDVSEDCIRDAVGRQGFQPRHARVKPLLNEKRRRERLKWCQERLDWDIPRWHSLLWTDETSMQVLGVKNRPPVRPRYVGNRHCAGVGQECYYYVRCRRCMPVLGGGPIYQKQVPKADRKSGKVGVVLA